MLWKNPAYIAHNYIELLIRTNVPQNNSRIYHDQKICNIFHQSVGPLSNIGITLPWTIVIAGNHSPFTAGPQLPLHENQTVADAAMTFLLITNSPNMLLCGGFTLSVKQSL